MSNERNQKEQLEKRDIELENVVGNLMIAEYQVEKLRGMVAQKIGIYGYGTDKRASSHMFKHDNKWFKISVKVEELAIGKVQVNQEIE
jgi:hypothetical protein